MNGSNFAQEWIDPDLLNKFFKSEDAAEEESHDTFNMADVLRAARQQS